MPARAGQDVETAQLADVGDPVVVETSGRPVVGEDGKPLHVAKDGRTLLDSKGKVLRDRSGNALRIDAAGRVPAAATPTPSGSAPSRKRGRSPKRGGSSRPKRPEATRPSASAEAPGPGPVTVAVAYLNPRTHNTLMQSVGAIQMAADPAPLVKAVEGYVNVHGGIAGRQLEVEPYEYTLTAADAYDEAQMRRSCEDLRAMHPDVVVHTGLYPWIMIPCLSGAGIPMVSHWAWAMPATYQKQFASTYFSPSGRGLDRIVHPYVQALLRTGFLDRGSRVGMVYYGKDLDSNVFDGAKGAIEWELAQAGIETVAEWAMGQEDNPRYAIEHFRKARVNRVVTLDSMGYATGAFLLFCASDPRGCPWKYAVTSASNPGGNARQTYGTGLKGSVGIGWAPIMDVESRDEGEIPSTRALCQKIYADAGYDSNVELGDRTAFGLFTALGYCENLLYVAEAAERSGSVTPAGLRRGMEALGSSFPSGLTLGTNLTNGRHDGPVGYRVMRHDARCRCYRYEGPLLED